MFKIDDIFPENNQQWGNDGITGNTKNFSESFEFKQVY